jgi:hypothetical protein
MSAQAISRLVTGSYSNTSVTNDKLTLNAVKETTIENGAVSFDKLSYTGRRFDAHTGQVITSNISLGSGDLNSILLVDSTTSRTITLPSTASGVLVGDWVRVCSVSGSASTNNIIIDPGAGSSINNNTNGDRLRLDIDNSTVTLVYAGSNNWEIVERVF